ncbi:MAG: HAD family phosphatase [Muribaculaceae bacterium]|nr:HAD family phosphatase [Muribaculaceae bacterium]
MPHFKTIVFDLGGVIFKLDKNQALNRFIEIGFTDAPKYLDAYEQVDFFGDLESGRITDVEFRDIISRKAGFEISMEQCRYAWTGYAGGSPVRSLEHVTELRRMGYRVCILSNTNPFMMQWVLSGEFDGKGHGLDHYFDALYLSYRMKVMKPDARIFKMMLESEKANPAETIFIDDGPRNVEAAAQLGITTLLTENGSDWWLPLHQLLNKE